ncbi:MAG: tyrosine-type recombinase/integrase [Planctomycetaceae bacterium]|nr:tyrosine-type recombinase/integrase [Planctomycetaceae bacterium]
MQVDTWTAKFKDENDNIRRIPTKETNRKIAEQILAQYEKEVARIKTGIITREELDKAQVKHTPLDGLLDQYRTKMLANGLTQRTIDDAFRKIFSLLSDCEIDSLAKIRRETVERWVANEIHNKKRAAGTINSYLSAVRCFVQYLVDTDILSINPIRSIRHLNTELDRRKLRRAMTKEEVERFLTAAAKGITKKVGSPEERVLIYKLLLGTGLRSTELSLLTPSQIDFEKCRLRVEAIKTKNKKADILPLRADLVQALQERMETLAIKPHERFFHHNQASLRKPFYADLKAAGIARLDSAGRCIDIHSLRKTFGTLLAAAGVPLTMVQRLMRHSNPQLTAKLYIDVEPVDMMQALDQLPGFS